MKKMASFLVVRLFSSIIAIYLIICLFGIDTSKAETSVLLPEYKISQTTPTDPPEVKELLGKWTGIWEGKLDSVLVVTEIDIAKKQASVIYAWGDAPIWRINHGYNKIVAEFVPGEKPTIKWERQGFNQPYFEFVLNKDKLQGVRRAGPSYPPSYITMTKTP